MAKKIWEKMRDDRLANEESRQQEVQQANQDFQNYAQNSAQATDIWSRVQDKLNLAQTQAPTNSFNYIDTKKSIQSRVNEIANMIAPRRTNIFNTMETNLMPILEQQNKEKAEELKNRNFKLKENPELPVEYTEEQKRKLIPEVVKKVTQPDLGEVTSNFFNDSGRTIENAWIGLKHGVEDSSNYIGSFFTGVQSENNRMIKRVLDSNLTDEEKRAYIYNNLNSEEANTERLNAMIENLMPAKNVPQEIYDVLKAGYDEQLKKMKEEYGFSDKDSQKYADIYSKNKDKIDAIALKDEFEESRKAEDTKIAENIENQTNIVSRKLAEISPSMGQMLPGMGLSMINPVLGTTYFTTSAGGGYVRDAEERGMSPYEAKTYGTIMGTLEGLSESVITGQQANRILHSFGKRGISTGVLNSTGFNILENVVQEAIMEPAQELTAELVGGKDKANWDNMQDRMFNAGLNGGIMGLISNGATYGLEKTGKAYNKIKNGQALSENEINAVIQENVKARGQETVENDFKQGANQVFQQVSTIQNEQSNAQEQQITPPVQENVSNQNVVANNQDRERRLQELKNIDTSNMRFIERGKIKTEIRALEQGFNSIEEYQKAEQIKREQAQKEYEQRQKEKELEKIEQQQQLEKEIQESNPTKRAQYEIIQKTNPMLDDYHTGIRSPKDIKTFNEVINDEESFAWGDFSKEDAQNALEQGKITIYSSYPIENGTFVSTSKVQAEDYAGGKGKKVYSKEVPLGEVAWINGDEGQYAKVDSLANNQQINNFSGYTQREINNIKSNKISIAQSSEDISKFVNNSRKISGNFKMYLGKIKESASNLIKNKLGINVDNYNISLKTDDVRKIFKDHGSEKTEIPRGQVPITENDFLNIPDIINNPDSISLEGKSPQGKPAIKFEKNIDGNTVVVTYVSDKHNNLEMQTMYKFKNNKKRDSATVLHENQAPGLNTSEMDSGTNLFINNSIPQNNEVVKNDTITNNYEQNSENNTQNTPGEKINWNKIERPEGKFRKHYLSVIESSNTTAEAKAIAKEMMGLDTYTPQSNESLLQKADKRISMSEPDAELNSLLSRAMNNDKVSDVDIAVGERLIEYYSKIGDKEHLQDSIHATALAGTQAGRTVQAMALLNHMTPQGQLVWLQRSIDKMNDALQTKYRNKSNTPQFELTQEMTDKILNTNSKEEMFKALDDVYEELGQQVPKSMSEKIDEWRYFSMLANIKTHGRNMIGNVAMHMTQRAKDKVAGIIESAVSTFKPNMERTHTIMPASKEVKQFAKNDLKNMDVQTELGMNENKYNPQSRLQGARKTFKHDILNNTLGKLFDLNSNLLEVEDNIGLKSMYVKALSEYITANKIDVNNITDAQLSKARQHAIKSSQEATFHQASALATALNQMGKKNNVVKFALDSAVPFKKTPINVAKTGAQYSPVGLIKSAIFDTAQLRKGKITVNQYIDNISKGLTGTGIAFMGYALAEAGILKASGGDDDKKEQYDEDQGKQSYSIEIGGKTYSLDWLSPVGIPLFIGAETNQQFNQSKKEKNSKSTDDEESLNKILKSVSNIMNASANAMNPMSEMSMVQGLTSILSSYNKENAVGDMIVNTGKSYVNQFVPTLLGQVARTTDDYERTTKSTKTGTLEKAIDSTVNQIKSKIPGLRQTLPVKTDIWGQEVKQSENLPFRAFNNFVNPAKVQDVSNDIVDKELNSLYAKTKESSIIPKTIEKTFSINGTDYRMTNEEFAKYSKAYGTTSHNILESLVKSDEYRYLTDEQKQKAIESVYSYAKEKNKVDYANSVAEELKTSTLYKTMQELKTSKNQSKYLDYVAQTKGIEKESAKNKILLESDYDDNVKSIIYANGTGNDDKLYSIMQDSVDINEYLDYKLKSSNKEFSADKDSNGKTITNSAKKKMYNYVNNQISGRINKLLILANNYKLSRGEQNEILEYIKDTSDNEDEVKEKLKKLSSNFELRNDKIYYK